MTLANPSDGRHILVVDDDDRLRDLLREFLTREGYRVTVAAHAGSARKLVELLDFDLLIVDVMMPGEDGLSLTRSLRAESTVPVLILTARGSAGDRIDGLTAGADDYLAKPFEPQELLLRVAAILRRAGPKQTGPKRLSLGEYAFDLDRGELLRGEELIKLTEGEQQLMRALALKADQPVDRLELARTNAGQDRDATLRAVDVQMTRLRRKIERDPRTPRYLQTVRGVGYMLAPD